MQIMGKEEALIEAAVGAMNHPQRRPTPWNGVFDCRRSER
jgi:hypothetical protein